MTRIAIILSLLVVSVLGFEDEEYAHSLYGYNLYTDEAKAIVTKVTGELDKMNEETEEFIEKIKKECPVAKALQSYLEVAETADGTSCASLVEEGHEDDETKIATVIDECQSSVPTDDLQKLMTAVTDILGKVSEIDRDIKTNAELCTSLRGQTTECEDYKEKALKKLKDSYTSEDEAKIWDIFNNGLLNVKVSIDSCIAESTSDLKSSLDSTTKEINECLDSLVDKE